VTDTARAAELLAELLEVLSPAPASSEWIDLAALPMATAAKAAARAGTLEARRAGKKMISHRDEIARWISTLPTIASERGIGTDEDGDDVDRILRGGGLARVA